MGEDRGQKRKDIDDNKSVSEKMDHKVLEKHAKQDLEFDEYIKKRRSWK